MCSGVPPKNEKNKVRKEKCNRFGGTGSQFSTDFFFSRYACPLMPHNRPQRKKGPQSPQRFVWQTNLRLQCKVLSPRPYPTYWPCTCDREELAWVTLGKSCRLGDGQYNHPLPCSGPMHFKNSMNRGFHLSIPFAHPLIDAQIHPNRQKHVKAY